MSKKDALNWISENESRIIEISDKIWEFAEVGLQEFKSSALLADELEKAGFKAQRGVAGMPTAFVASYGTGKPVIGIMGEYDALPGLSQKTVPKKDPLVPGAPGHGCGHNIHGTSGVAGAIAVKTAMEKGGIKGTIKFFGCPAEETLVGKVFMVRDGLFNGVDAVLSHHPMMSNMAGLSSALAMNSVKFHFHGVAAHGAANPDQGRGAMDAVELMDVGMNFMREHIVQEARIHNVIEEAGHEPNVIPAYARSWYYIRAPDRDQVESIYKWLQDIAKGADLMAGTTHEVEFLTGVYNTLTNRTLSELVTANMREIKPPAYTKEDLEFARELGKTFTREQKKVALQRWVGPTWDKLLDVDLDNTVLDAWNEGLVMPGSTDVADVSWQTPTQEFGTASFVLGSAFHSWQATAVTGMSIGHKSLIFGAKTLAASVYDLLTKPEVLKKARDEFASKTRGHVYKSPLPPDLKPPLTQLR